MGFRNISMMSAVITTVMLLLARSMMTMILQTLNPKQKAGRGFLNVSRDLGLASLKCLLPVRAEGLSGICVGRNM